MFKWFVLMWAATALLGVFTIDLAPSGPRCLPADAVYITKWGASALTLGWGTMGFLMGKLGPDRARDDTRTTTPTILGLT